MRFAEIAIGLLLVGLINGHAVSDQGGLPSHAAAAIAAQGAAAAAQGAAAAAQGAAIAAQAAVDAHITGHGCTPYTHDCVPYYQCIDGVINTSGEGLIDTRFKPLSTCTNADYPDITSQCCRIPGATAPPTPAPISICPGGKVCVEHGLCLSDGSVNTDGVGLIDVRINLACYIHPDSPVVGVCCKPPPVEYCPGSQVCLIADQCVADAAVSATGPISYTECVLDRVNYVTGFCCDPPLPPLPPPANTCGVRNYGLDVRAYDPQRPLLKTEALFGEFPWQAIIFFSNFTFKCGGSLVGDKWLLTGAHCVHGYQYGDFKIRLGEYQVNTYDEPLPYIDVDIAHITIHPGFNPKNLHNNFAVIELATPVPFYYHINTVCLPSPGQYPLPGTRCIATGWGKDAFDGQYQTILKTVDLPIVDDISCQNSFRTTRLGKHFILDESLLCAGGEPDHDTCTGDGGGPLVCKDPHTGQYFLQGITSWGIGCGEAYIPGAYADVQEFISWIYPIIYGDSLPIPGNPYGRK